MEERLLQPSKEKPSYGSLDEEEEDDDEIDGEEENVTVILRRGGNKKVSSSKTHNDSSSLIPSHSGSSSLKTIHSNHSKPSKSSITNNSGKSSRKSNPDGERKSLEGNRSQRSSTHPTMGVSSSSQSSVANGGGSPDSKNPTSLSSECEKEDHHKPGTIRRLTSSTSVSWIMRNIRKFLVKYWIWIVALMLMLMSVGGTRVVIYRVFYMFLFLTFILTFQLSYRLWRRILFTFWLIVISYSFTVLTALYSYQFHGFTDYWSTYLHINPDLQADIGLYKFRDDEWWLLFKELFTPTFLIIITVIQLKCFHPEFMDLTRDEDQVPSILDASDSTRHTILPTLTEESGETPKQRRNSFGGSSEHIKSSPDGGQTPSTGTKSSTSSPTSPLIPPAVETADIVIDMDHAIITGNVKEASDLKPHPRVDSVSSSSKRSTHFAENSRDPTNSKRTSFNDPTSQQRSSVLLTPNSKGIITRRKTLAEITPVKIDDLRVAASDIRVRAHSLWDSAKPGMGRIYETAWKFLELHMIKVVFFTAFYVAVEDVSVINFVYVLLVAITVPMGRFEPLVTSVFAIWSAVLIISKMLFQLSVSDYFQYDYACDKVNTPLNLTTYTPFNNVTAVDYRWYIGFKKVDNVFNHVWKYLIILLVLTLNQLVTLRQKVHRWRYNDERSEKTRYLLFPEVSRKNADDGFMQSVKFLLNYGFYKFGLEVTILSMILLIGQRMDIMSVAFTLWLFCHALLKRRVVRRIWPAFTLFITIMIPIQYLSSLGFPLFLCYEYPWFQWLDPELRSWLFLPDYRLKPEGSQIFYDFIVLLLSSRQWLVFKKETDSKMSPFDEGGSNEETFYTGHEEHKRYIQQQAERRKTRSKDGLQSEDEHPDFFTGKTLLDYFKSYFFSGFYWVTLAVVFLTATGRTNFFGLGYILGCFFFLWNGSEFYLKDLRQIVKTWKWIIAYCATVIFLKTVLHVVGCVENDFFFGSTYCWISKLLGIVCKCKIIRKPLDPVSLEVKPDVQNSCYVQENTSGLLLDGVCFCFLLIQKRIFGSYYFTYLIKDIKAQQVLASRGAELIHEIQAKEVMEQEEAERDVMEKIKTKMERIRAYQQSIKMQQDTELPPEKKSHRQAVRSGDYYLFDEQALALDQKEIELEEKSRKSLIPDPEGDELRRIANLRGISAFMSQLLKGELQQDSEAAMAATPEGPIFHGEYLDTDLGDSSRDSAIVSVDRDIEEVDLDASQATSVTSVEASSVRPTTSRRVSSLRPGAADVTDGVCASKDAEDEVSDEDKKDEEGEAIEGSWWLKVINYFYIMCWFIESCVISATAKLNHVSRDYRYVSRRLAVEKRALKLLFEMEEVKGDNYDQEWKKTTLEKISRATVSLHRTVSQESFRRMKKEFTEKSAGQTPAMKKQMSTQSGPLAVPGTSGQNESSFIAPKDGQLQDVDGASDEVEEITLISSNAFLRLFRSLFYTVVSQSEIVCYAMVILNQLINASLLSLPLPIMVFLWGCMSVPRPSKTFWISLITYTEAVVVAKYAFNFGVWPWLDYTSWQPKVVTSETRDQELVNTNIDLVLLLFLFFHRFMLKTLGLWDLDESVSRDGFQCKVEKPGEPSSAKAGRSERSTPGLRKRKIRSDDKTAPVDGPLVETPASKSSADQLTVSNEDQLIESMSMDSRIDDTTRPVKKFYHRLLHPPFRICHDLYTYMFVCDFINFFIVVFAFNAFGSSSGESITKYFEDNKVPVPFLTMVMAQFCSMIIDRALYLRKNIKGRLLFHILLVIIIHFWLFFILPHVTDQKFTNLSPPKAWYIFKCVYLLLSAVQVKGGYPTRILGNTFTKKYSYFNLYLFKGYMLVPFLYDMRLIMDWIWTDTSLELDEWSIMEDMFKNLFQRKCELQFQANFPEFRGNPRRMFTKYMLGGAWLVMIVGAIWFPLVIFAVGGTVGKNNRPVDVAVELEISGYVPLARMTATKVNETNSMLTEKQYSDLKSKFTSNKEAGNFLTNYDYEDTSLVQLNGNSTPVWGVSPPSLEALKLDLNNTETKMDFKITWYISRHKQTKTQNMDLTVYKSKDISLNMETRRELLDMLNAPETGLKVVVPHIFPNFLRVPEKGEPEAVRQLPIGNSKDPDRLLYRNITITLREDVNNSQKWFEIGDICSYTDDHSYPFSFTGRSDCDYVLLMLFNERIFPAGLQIISGYGIVGLYTTFVFLVSRLIRGLFDDLSFKVIYTQMPNVDKVLQLALDIYLVRESREFTLEEDLYGKLLFLYRSPETLVKWTKQIEEDQFEKQKISRPAREEQA